MPLQDAKKKLQENPAACFFLQHNVKLKGPGCWY